MSTSRLIKAKTQLEFATESGNANIVFTPHGTGHVAMPELQLTTPLGVAYGGCGANTAAGARTALGLAIGTDVQAHSASLQQIADLSASNGQHLEWNGSAWVAANHDEEATTASAPLVVTAGNMTLTLNSAHLENNGSDQLALVAGGVGATELATNAVTNVKVATGLDAAKLADGSVSNTQFQYLNTLSSNVQTQLDAKQPLATNLTAIAAADVPSAGEDGKVLAWDQNTSTLEWTALPDPAVDSAAAPLSIVGGEMQLALNSNQLEESGNALQIKSGAVLTSPNFATQSIHQAESYADFQCKAAGAQTTNDTWTDVLSHTLNSSECANFTVKVAARKTSDNTVNAYNANFLAKNVAGTASLVSAQNIDVVHEDNAGYDVQMVVTGAAVKLQVKGGASDSVNWSASFQVQRCG